MQPPFLPEAPLPHKSFSIIVILIEGFFSLIFNAVQRPVNPPPTIQISEVISVFNSLISNLSSDCNASIKPRRLIFVMHKSLV